MTGQLRANLRSMVASAFLLPLLEISCQSHGAKSKELVSVDLTRLELRQNDASLPAQISLVPIKSVRLLPESVRSRIPKMSNPGGPFNAGDVSLFFDIPRRRLIFGGISGRYCLVHYEYGGIAAINRYPYGFKKRAPLYIGGILSMIAKVVSSHMLALEIAGASVGIQVIQKSLEHPEVHPGHRRVFNMLARIRKDILRRSGIKQII